jgi:hypothetical protein
MNKSNTVPLTCLGFAFLTALYLFWASRSDPSLRLAAFVSISNLVSTFTAISSTLLTGKDLTYTGNKSPVVNTTETGDINVDAKKQ